jgi:hypothetical protein
MRSRSRFKTLAVGIGLPALAGVLVMVLLLGSSGDRDGQEPASGGSRGTPALGRASAAASPTVAVVWGLEDARPAARRLARHDVVESTTVVRRGAALLTSAGRSDGRTVERVRRGFAIPLDVVSVDPSEYAATVPRAVRRRVTGLRPGEALLSRTSARLRRIDTGGALRLADGRRLRVAGVLPDALVQFAELLVGDSERMPSARDSVLAVLGEGSSVGAAELARAAGGDARARLLAPSNASAAVPRGPARPAELKARFGEPAVALPYGDDWVRLESGFLRRNIRSVRVPILGTVSCHREMIAPLRAAMGELVSRGLGGLVDRDDYAGCYAPRRIRPGGALSLHAWGLAVDLNASANPHGGRSAQDRRLVRTMERHGFSWGGNFPTRPDPMHFEFRGR